MVQDNFLEIKYLYRDRTLNNDVSPTDGGAELALARAGIPTVSVATSKETVV